MSDFKDYKLEGESVIYTGSGEFVFVIPEIFFSSKSAIIVGEYVNILGIVDYFVEKDGKMGELRTFFFPTVFLTQPYTIDKVKDFKLTPTASPDEYRFLRYRKGDKIVVQNRVPKRIQNVEEMFRLFVINGHVSKSIPYNKEHEYFIENAKLSDTNYGVSYQMIGLVIAETNRDINDQSRPFRLSAARKAKKWKEYENVSIYDLPKYISPIVNISSQYFDDSVLQSIMQDPKDMKDSPLERVLYKQ